MSDEIRGLIESNAKLLGELRDTHAKQTAGFEERIRVLSEAMDAQRQRIDELSALPLPPARKGGAAYLDWNAEWFRAAKAYMGGETHQLGMIEAKIKELASQQKCREGAERYYGQADAAQHFLADSGSGTAGGWLVPPDMGARFVQVLRNSSGMFSWAETRQTNAQQVTGRWDGSDVSISWVGETGARPASQEPSLGAYTYDVKEYCARFQLTGWLLEDAEDDPIEWLMDKFRNHASRALNGIFVNGNHPSQPTGFLTPVPVANPAPDWKVPRFIVSGHATTVNNFDALVRITNTLEEGYRPNAAWYMRPETAVEYMLMKDTTNRYLWQPSLVAGSPATLLGYPVRNVYEMATQGAGQFPVYFGDMRQAYQISIRRAVRTLFDPYTAFPSRIMNLSGRLGGYPVNMQALIALKCSV